jgi:hypothetical protein
VRAQGTKSQKEDCAARRRGFGAASWGQTPSKGGAGVQMRVQVRKPRAKYALQQPCRAQLARRLSLRERSGLGQMRWKEMAWYGACSEWVQPGAVATSAPGELQHRTRPRSNTDRQRNPRLFGDGFVPVTLAVEEGRNRSCLHQTKSLGVSVRCTCLARYDLVWCPLNLPSACAGR